MQKVWPGGSARSDLTSVLRGASLLYALAVAVVTLLPSDLAGQLGFATVDAAADGALAGFLAYLAAGVVAGLLIVVPWRLGLAKRLRVSWPLFLCALGYVVAMALLASEGLRSALYELLAYDVPDWLIWAFGEIDPLHAAGYVGLGLLAGIAWRDRLHPVPTGGIVFAFGWILEELQRFAPGREPSPVDLTSNALGILIGYVGIGLLAALTAEPKPPRGGRAQRRREPHGARRSRRAGDRGQAPRRPRRRFEAGRSTRHS